MLNLAADAQAEDMELFFVRLKNPQGGATINYPDTAYVYVTEAGATTKLRLVSPDPRVNEIRAKALVTVSRTGSLAGATQLSYRTLPAAGYAGFTEKQGELMWADGDAESKVISIDLDPTRLSDGQTGAFQVELSGATNATLESSSGAASTLTANITVVGEGQSTVTPPPPPPTGGGAGNSKGGGGMMLWWLAVLAVFAGVRRRASARLQS